MEKKVSERDCPMSLRGASSDVAISGLSRSNAFTLLELLVVIAIIAIIAAMLLPATQKAITNAKNNRALAEMAQFAAIIQLVYSEVGYYVRLEDVVKECTIGPNPYLKSGIRNWLGYTDGEDDNEGLDTIVSTGTLWAGPYTTYKKYLELIGATGGPRPTDPWGKQYRMYWSTNSDIKPAGANGTMIIISAGANKTLDSFDASHHNPAGYAIPNGNYPTGDNDDLYFNFNAGIQ